METQVGILLAVAVVALGIGIAVDRWLLTRTSRKEIARAKEQAAHLLAQAEQDATVFRKEHVDKAKAALARTREAFEQERDESKQALRRSRQKQEQRHEKLDRRAQRINDRETTLHEATDMIEALRRETEHAQRQAEQFRARTEALLQEATTRREQIERQQQELAALKKSAAAKQATLDRMIEQ